ncbi:hypothetical protein M758_UG045300 [Ceratodon purpureus]|nr:hypothetical protein M758_UG045300 [Ceratodon purpureus]
MRLARFDYAQLEAPQWVAKAEYEAQQFNYSWNILNTSWCMTVPFSDARYRTSPLSDFTNTELAYLRSRLNGNGNTPVYVLANQKLQPRFDLWVAPSARA